MDKVNLNENLEDIGQSTNTLVTGTSWSTGLTDEVRGITANSGNIYIITQSEFGAEPIIHQFTTSGNKVTEFTIPVDYSGRRPFSRAYGLKLIGNEIYFLADGAPLRYDRDHLGINSRDFDPLGLLTFPSLINNRRVPANSQYYDFDGDLGYSSFIWKTSTQTGYNIGGNRNISLPIPGDYGIARPPTDQTLSLIHI